MLKKLLITLLFTIFISSPAFALKSVEEQRKDWNTWLASLKKEMVAKGISQKTINRAYQKDYFHAITPEMLKHDKKQTEFVLTSDVYINRLVNKDKVDKARTSEKI